MKSSPGPASTGVPPRGDGRRSPAAAQAWARLRDRILRADLPPGAPLSDLEVAAELGISRTPVREAILRLQLEGLLDVVPQVGTFVARLDRQAIDDALFAREQIECGALATVVAPLEPSALARLRSCLGEHRAAIDAGDHEATMAADDRFHWLLLCVAGRPGVWPIVRDVRDQLRRVRALALPRLRSGSDALAQHRRVVDALARGDVAGAVDLLRDHMSANGSVVARLAQLHPGYFTEHER
jgi:DNA-binding GntR family transcriptional regulator